jgi:hypothetical protein
MRSVKGTTEGDISSVIFAFTACLEENVPRKGRCILLCFHNPASLAIYLSTLLDLAPSQTTSVLSRVPHQHQSIGPCARRSTPSHAVLAKPPVTIDDMQ